MKSFVSRRNAEAIRRRFQPWNGLHLSLVSPMRTKGFCAQSAVHQYDESGRKLKSFSREQEMKDIRTLLQYCIDNKALPGAKRMYIRMIEKGFEPGVFQGNGILNTHVKAGLLKDARQLFDRMPKRDEVSWTIMIAGRRKGTFSTTIACSFGDAKRSLPIAMLLKNMFSPAELHGSDMNLLVVLILPISSGLFYNWREYIRESWLQSSEERLDTLHREDHPNG
ncbi:hypothetical protein SUGI_0143570 [Cryptomeria japonica]|nr:hypothetical protein SUGI_0143570 [Cryptomeria japonica]